MNTLKLIVLASTAFVAFAAVAPGQAAEQSPAAASAALTRDQHLALAEQFDAKAESASDKAAAHEVMARSAAPKGDKLAMAGHCAKLTAQYRAEADAFAAQAAAHRLAAR
jgi:hypothetical protein